MPASPADAACPICAAPLRRKYAPYFHSELLRCAACGYELQRDPPPAERLASIYGTDYYRSYGDRARTRRQKEVYYRGILDRAGLDGGARVLEVGCGTGVFLGVCTAAGLEAWGLDINPAGLEAAAAFVPPERLHAGPFESYPPGRVFDAVFMFDYIEHVPEPRSVVARARERLRAGGLLVLVTPCATSLSNRLFGRRWPHYIEEHLSFFSRRAMRLLLEGAGFERVRIRSYPKRLTVRYLASQANGKSMALAPFLRAAARLLPGRLGSAILPLPTGDILVSARKPDADAPGDGRAGP